MRLICPNCGAQYEVDEAVIPDAGRDVQCSNCGHTWFQPPAHLDKETAEELDIEVPAPEAPADPAPTRKELDPDVANVLREEAALEAEARKAEAEGLETQPDLGIDESAQAAADRSAAARARMARLRGIDEAEEAAALDGMPVPPGSRKELLPDVEEINSSLRATQDRDVVEEMPIEPGVEQPPEVVRKGSSGKWAFRVIVILALIALALYVFAAQIVQAVPQTEPILTSYVGFVNGLRDQVDPMIADAVASLKGLLGMGEDAAQP